MTALTMPDHVPADLVIDYDYLAVAPGEDIWAHFARLHQMPDIFFSPRHGGHWVVSRHADIEAVFENRAGQFNSSHSSLPIHPFPLLLAESDGQIHADLRALLAPFFSPKSIGDLEAIAQDLAKELIDGFESRGECDFVTEFAQKLPIIILMNLLDLPMTDVDYLLGLSEAIVRGVGNAEEQSAVQAAAYAELAVYIRDKVIPVRRANPGKDMFSALIHGSVEGGRMLNDEEVTSLGCLMIAAGLDTVASMLGMCIYFLAEHPAAQQYVLDDPARLPTVVEELMRRHHIANVARTVVADTEFKGVRMKAGDLILLPTPASGLDESRYSVADTVDFSRKGTKSLVFGRGVHQCIGSFLARTELRTAIRVFLDRIPHFTLASDQPPQIYPGKVLALRSLPLRWSVA